MRMERVVVGMDFSTAAIEAARWMSQYLAPYAELILCHVIDLPRTPSFLRGGAPEWLGRAHRIGTHPQRDPSGRPHEVLTRHAEEKRADLSLQVDRMVTARVHSSSLAPLRSAVRVRRLRPCWSPAVSPCCRRLTATTLQRSVAIRLVEDHWSSVRVARSVRIPEHRTHSH
jgi:nucleotide-binding universal stress UspA family protein